MKSSVIEGIGIACNLVATAVSATVFGCGTQIIASSFKSPILQAATYAGCGIGSMLGACAIGEITQNYAANLLVPFEEKEKEVIFS